MTILESTVERIGGKVRWKDASGGVVEIPVDGTLQVFAFSRGQTDDKDFIQTKLRMMGYGEKLPNTLA